PESEPATIRIRAVDVIPGVFDPLPDAKLSMCTGKSCRRQMRTKGSRGGPHGLADVVHEPLDELGVVAFRHHSDQGLGARLADDESAAPLELGFRGGDP